MEFDLKDISIVSAFDVDTDLLNRFYCEVFPQRIPSLLKHWKWVNRSCFYDNKIPLVMVLKGKIIGHAGMIPFIINIGNKTFSACWFIDFFILPDVQRIGLGQLISKKLMESFDLVLGLGMNEKSMGVLRKLEWVESFDNYLHFNFMLPFDYPYFVTKLLPGLRRTGNLVLRPFLLALYKRHSIPDPENHITKLTEVQFQEFTAMMQKSRVDSGNIISPVRDEDFLKWRISDSPNRDKYYYYRIDGFGAILFLNDHSNKYIDILWVSDITNHPAIRDMIASVAVYGMRKGYSFSRFYTSDPELSSYLRKTTKSLVRRPKFAFYAKDAGLSNSIKSMAWNWELVDHDFEQLQ